MKQSVSESVLKYAHGIRATEQREKENETKQSAETFSVDGRGEATNWERDTTWGRQSGWLYPPNKKGVRFTDDGEWSISLSAQFY